MNNNVVERNKQLLLDFLFEKTCKDCGNPDIRVLTFDHRNPKNKSATVSSLVHKGYSWDRVMKEIKKTDVVCLNCHTIRECVRSGSRRQQYWEEKGYD